MILYKKYQEFLTCLYFSISPISKILEGVGVNRYYTYVAFLMLFFFLILWDARHLSVDILLFYGIIVPVVVLGLLQNIKYIHEMTNIIAVFWYFCLPYYIFRKIDLDCFFDILRKAAYITLIYYIIEAIATSFDSNNYMSYSYNIQLASCVVFFFAYTEKKAYDIVLTIIALVTMFLFGSRGALVGVVIYLLFVFFQRMTKTKMLFCMAILLLFVIFLITMGNMQNVLENYNIKSRTLEKIVSGEFFLSNSRNNLYEQCRNLIKENPFGYGVMTSRKLIKHYIYPHSLMYELILDYGIFFGVIFFFGILMISFKLMFREENYKIKNTVALFCILGLVMLIVSSSLYYEYYIPGIIALYFNILNRKRENGKEEKICV